MRVWNIAIYARVSTDKENQKESIPAQIQSLKEWIIERGDYDKENIYNLVEIYKDEGFSGSNFERDAFVKMKKDIASGKINMILTRDLSRFSRNYIMAGYYIEDYFKSIGIRFVSILDNVDTLEENNDIIPFKNILNEMYIKDCSRRTKDGLKQRMLRGSSIASKPPYGYRFLEEYVGNVKTIRLIPAGDETTEIVKKVYELYIQGWSMRKIALFLNAQGIKPPSANLKNFVKSKEGIWTSNSVKYILTNPKYAGIMVQGRWKKVSYKVKKVINIPKEQWIYGGEFDGIISKETFEEVQKIIYKKRKKLRYKNNEIHIFSGVLQCKECGGSMCYRKSYKGYKCTNSQRGGKRCTAHSVKEEFLQSIIKEDLNKCISESDIDEIYGDFIRTSNFYSSYDQHKVLGQRLKKLDEKINQLYNDKLNGIINERNFYYILKETQEEQKKVEAERARLQEDVKNSNGEENHNRIKKRINDILGFDDLNRNIIESLIEKIIVSENQDTGEKCIDIFYKFSN